MIDAVMVSERAREVTMRKISNRLDDLLKEKGISLAELQRRITRMGDSVSYDTLRQVRDEARDDTHMSTAIAICLALDVTLDTLFPLEEQDGTGV
jgi:hypothetical protein